MKKTRNPFKMWQSYVGAGVGFLPVILNSYSPEFSKILTISRFILPDITSGGGDIIGYAIATIGLNIVLGFLIGWGITLLWRKIK